MVKIEVCASNLASAIAAHQGGAFRIELCDNLAEGGTTPSYGVIQKVRERVPLLINVLIRPRGGDFVYDDDEMTMMKTDIVRCAELGCDGVVIGLLTPDGDIDLDRNQSLIHLAHQHNLSVTFHRAFDCCRDLPLALEQIITLNCQCILTSGGYPSALAGAGVLKSLVEQADHRIEIMAGAGITVSNLAELLHTVPLSYAHGSFRQRITSTMQYQNPHFNRDCGMYDYHVTEAEQVKRAVTIAEKY